VLLLLLQALLLLDLSHNTLSGTLPREWGSLGALSYLYLNTNNLTLDELPCEWGRGMLSLKLADLSGNRVLPRGVAAAAAAAAAVAGVDTARAQVGGCSGTNAGPKSREEAGSSSSSRMLLQANAGMGDSDVHTNMALFDSGNHSLGSNVHGSKFGGRLDAPRCWLRRFCYEEGAFVCLQRHPQHPAGGCTSYVYGASDLHIDASNQVSSAAWLQQLCCLCWLYQMYQSRDRFATSTCRL
jgi:hypothetical protein